SAIAFTSDGTCIVPGSSDGSLQLCDAVSGERLKTWNGHQDSVPSLSRSSTQAVLITSTSPIWYITNDGWIYSIALERRICWIPVSCRPSTLPMTRDLVTLAMNRDRVALGTEDGHV